MKKSKNVLPVQMKEVKGYRKLLPIKQDFWNDQSANPLIIFYSNKRFTAYWAIRAFCDFVQIIHEMQITFESNLTVDIRCVFLNISIAFDKVWYYDHILKLKLYDIVDKLLSLLENYLKIINKGQF